MKVAKPDMILADTPYLALAAGKTAGILAVALVSFTWDLILSEFQAPPSIDSQVILQSIRQAYGQADLVLRITPAPKLLNFQHATDIGPIADPAPSARKQLAEFLGLAPGEHTVLVGFGGIPLDSLPFETLESLTTYRFLFDGSVPSNSSRCISIKCLPLSFKTLAASVDVIMTKPGYGTLVEAVALRTPMVYVRRYNFGDEQSLVDYLHQYGQGVELSLDDFIHGHWEEALSRVCSLPTPSAPIPPATGANDAANLLVSYFSKAQG